MVILLIVLAFANISMAVCSFYSHMHYSASILKIEKLLNEGKTAEVLNAIEFFKKNTPVPSAFNLGTSVYLRKALDEETNKSERKDSSNLASPGI